MRFDRKRNPIGQHFTSPNLDQKSTFVTIVCGANVLSDGKRALLCRGKHQNVGLGTDLRNLRR